MSFAQDRHDQPQVVVVRSGHPGLIAGLLGCVLGLFGIFSIGIIFVPLGAICSLVGIIRGLSAGNGPGIGVSLLGCGLTLAGYFASPSLLLVTALGVIVPQVRQPPLLRRRWPLRCALQLYGRLRSPLISRSQSGRPRRRQQSR